MQTNILIKLLGDCHKTSPKSLWRPPAAGLFTATHNSNLIDGAKITKVSPISWFKKCVVSLDAV